MTTTSITPANGLKPGELPATGARQLRPPLRAALLAAAGGRLKRVRRGWCANGHPAPISDAVVADLKRRGLMIGSPINVSLSATGKWYARTIARDLAGQPQPNDQAIG